MLKQFTPLAPVGKEAYKQRADELRVALINAQFDLREADYSVLLLIAGDDREATNELVQLLHKWMDARHLETEVFLSPNDEERQRPRFWRYWRALPPSGKIGIAVGGWVLNAVADRCRRRLGKNGFQRRLAHIRRFEQTLMDDSVRVLKLWVHAPGATQATKRPRAYWKVRDPDWAIYEQRDRVLTVVDRMLETTHTERTPWHIIDSSDGRARDLQAGEILLRRLQEAPPPPVSPPRQPPSPDRLAGVDLSPSLSKERYQRQLERCQRELNRLTHRAREAGLASIVVFEGWDAAGKGGVIRRVTEAMSVSDYRVASVTAPTDEELAHHYLWRFWRRLPPAGRMQIFDRSWYGRVLVERVEGLASEPQWHRAYEEINDFEAQLTEHGWPVLKFWLHIDPDEQLARFKARENTPYKQHKITPDDYRNRERWDDYARAVNDMVEHTSTPDAPWHLVPANDKRYARIAVLQTVCERLEQALS